MRIPYVIDNQTNQLADVLNAILADAQRAHRSLDIASAYFYLSGYKELCENLERLGSFRLLLGFEPKAGQDVGLRPQATALNAVLRADLEHEPFNAETLRLSQPDGSHPSPTAPPG